MDSKDFIAIVSLGESIKRSRVCLLKLRTLTWASYLKLNETSIEIFHVRETF